MLTKQNLENEMNYTDVYNTSSNTKELDSDVNEDANREALLDASMRDFYDTVEQKIHEKESITNIPGESAFVAAEELDEEAGE